MKIRTHRKGIQAFALGMLLAVLILHSCLPDGHQPPCFDRDAAGANIWSDPYIGSDTTVAYYPDVHSNYWVAGFDLGRSSGIGFRIHGKYAFARYMSFNLYDAEVGTPLAGILDREISPNCHNQNPFDGGDESAADRSFVVHVVPGNTPTAGLSNPVQYPAALENLAIMLRYYLPEGDGEGMVELPMIEAFDTRTGESLPLPPLSDAITPDPDSFEDRLNQFFATQIDHRIRFYNISSENLFANIDNKYLAAAIDRSDGKLAAIRFRPPIMADSKDEIPGAQVRYWSIHLGGLNTATYGGIADVDAVGSDGDWVYFIFGDADDHAVRQVALEYGYNFIPWNLSSSRGIVIYRNLVTRDHFDGDISRVPILESSFPLNVFFLEARNFIGSYAPRGKRLDRSVFLSDPSGIF